ncbi:MAG: hypothetical protein WD027_03055 [Gaiellales bacterium]
MSRELRGALAGAFAALVWGAAEPLLQRAAGTPYSDIRLLGRTLTDGPHWRAAGLAMHAANGAAFGWVFARLGGRGWKQGIAAAELETIALWPGMAVVDRLHPDRRDGTWPPIVTDGRAFALTAAGHAVFGALLGALLTDD